MLDAKPTPQPQRADTHAGPLESSAAQLFATFRARADEQIEQRHLSDATVAALRASVLADIYWSDARAPFDLLDYVKAIAEVARADGATAWCVGTYSVSTWIVRRVFPPALTDTLSPAAGPPLFAGSVAPAGLNSLTPHAEGFTLSGRWRFVSGCHHADNVFVRVDAGRGKTFDFEGLEGSAAALVLLRPEDYVLEDGWRYLGLQGTGSNCLVVNERTIEAARVVAYDEAPLAAGDPTADWIEARLPHRLVMRLPIAATALGLARAALEQFTMSQSQRIARAHPQHCFKSVQRALSAAQLELDCAQLLIQRVCVEAQTLARKGEVFSPRLRARFARDLVSVVQRSAKQVDVLLRVAGAAELFDERPLQRIFRDTFAVASHFSCQPEGVLELDGGFTLGVEPAKGVII